MHLQKYVSLSITNKSQAKLKSWSFDQVQQSGNVKGKNIEKCVA